jgi:hypothetical protein
MSLVRPAGNEEASSTIVAHQDLLGRRRVHDHHQRKAKARPSQRRIRKQAHGPEQVPPCHPDQLQQAEPSGIHEPDVVVGQRTSETGVSGHAPGAGLPPPDHPVPVAQRAGPLRLDWFEPHLAPTRMVEEPDTVTEEDGSDQDQYFV